MPEGDDTNALAAARERRHIAAMAARPWLTSLVVGTSLLLGGCGSINTWLASTLADRVPQWAGGVPEGAPPRPGTGAYDEYRKNLESGSAQVTPRPEQILQAVEISSKAVY